MSRKNDIKELIILHNRRLQKLKEQAAIEGHSVDPKTLIEIEDIEAKVAELQRDLESLDTKPKQRIQIYLSGDFNSLSLDRRLAAIEAFAAVMGITPQEIEVHRVYEGSIVFDLGVPPHAVQRLRSILQANNAQLRLLRVENVIIEEKPDKIEEWVFKEGQFVSVTDSPSSTDNPKKLLVELKKNLNILQEREAKYGGNAPLELLNQIDDHQRAISLAQKAVAGHITGSELTERLKPLLLAVTVGQKAIAVEGVSKEEFNEALSNEYIDKGREKIRKWAERLIQDEIWDWNSLAHAIEYYVNAINYNPQNQHAWVNLAYVYHLIGERQKALEYLRKGFELATPGPNYPGRHYMSVKQAIDNNTFLSGSPIVHRPSIPDQIREKLQQVPY